MYEKVNPCHPDKIADRIAGAIVDLAYAKDEKNNPRIAVEALIGHGECRIIAESSVEITNREAFDIVTRIAGPGILTDIVCVKQDEHLAKNQSCGLRCGDNGIFRGVPTTREQQTLSAVARKIYDRYPTDGKYIFQENVQLIICQSNASTAELKGLYPGAVVNPLGDWTGGPNVDTGATNRKLGSDMGDAVTGGGLHGKDLSKADVSVNIWCHLQAQQFGVPVEACCAIGDDTVNGVPYDEIVRVAREYINRLGGFEKFAEWGLI